MIWLDPEVIISSANGIRRRRQQPQLGREELKTKGCALSDWWTRKRHERFTPLEAEGFVPNPPRF
jgi:hypothetical protein